MAISSRGIQIKLDEKQYQAVIKSLRNVAKSEESVISSAANKTAKKAQTWISNEARKVYLGEMPSGLKGRSSIRKSTVAKVGAEISFKSELPGVRKFQSKPDATPTVFSKSGPKRVRKLAVKDASGKEHYIYRTLGPQKKYTVTSRQRKNEASHTYHNAFMMTFKSGHRALVWRGQPPKSRSWKPKPTEKATQFPQRFPIQQAFGSSDRAMAENDDVYGVVEPQIQQYLSDQVAAALLSALQKAGKA